MQSPWAEPLHIQALHIVHKTLGEDHPNYTASINNLAGLYVSMREFAKAEPLYIQARDISQEHLGEDHPHYASSLNDLAACYVLMGEFAKAEPLYIQARDMRRTTLGENHPRYASSLNKLGRLYELMGAYTKAEAMYADGIAVESRHLEGVLPWLPSARASSLLRKQMGVDPWLSAARELPDVSSQKAWTTVWTSRGLLSRVLNERRALSARSPDVGPLVSRLRRVRQQLAQLALAVPLPNQRERRTSRITALNNDKEELERQLAAVSADFRQARQDRDTRPEDLLRILPVGTALVDLVEVRVHRRTTEGGGKLQRERHYEAFVAHTNTEKPGIAWVHLGPTKPIDAALVAWRTELADDNGRMGATRKPTAANRVMSSPANRLRQLLWEKIEPHLGKCRQVVVIPDGGLAVLPWSALPGSKPHSFLVEEFAISTINHGRSLYAILKDDTPQSEQLLVVGGVDYDRRKASELATTNARPPASAVPRRAPALAERLVWQALPGTGEEAARLAMLRKTGTRSLLGTAADENALLDSMPQAGYIHLATHGFFADPKFRSTYGLRNDPLFAESPELVTAKLTTVLARNPLILSGIVLAGVNQPSGVDKPEMQTGEDGILTAEEVVNLDLRRTQLVTLSACESGLGKIRGGGEGVFGLQRAFHLAGARTVVASLWKVDDRATQTLMVEFYKNLWERQLGKLEALRQAQLTMLAYYEPDGGTLTRGPGGQRPVNAKALEAARNRRKRERVDPFYWAAWTLSGDWR